MKTLTKKQLARQDFIDNLVFDLIQKANPTKKKIAWNIELIGQVRDALEDVLVDQLGICSEQAFYPFVLYNNKK